MPAIVWLKRDLRLEDHRPLSFAAKNGPLIFLYIVEEQYWALADTSYRQYCFLRNSLLELRERCEALGGSLTIKTGDAVSIFDGLLKRFGSVEIVAHEETGNYWTFERDEKVRIWCKVNGVKFSEFKQHGIARGHELDRDKWAKRWDAFMSEPVTPVPECVDWVSNISSDPIPSADQLGLPHDGILALQKGGRQSAVQTLESFLIERGQNYRKGMSSPISGERECSRMSPYLALGTISMREVYQRTFARKIELSGSQSPHAKMWRGAMTSFIGRLHWHCHFMQKLEAEPELEWLPMSKIYTELRGKTSNLDLVRAFEHGMTGFPFVDACMRYLRATGWINFRMRAMLTSFASYDLWLRWQDSGEVLARLFTDYEPGIHWPQAQMQSGETGINAIRIYSPVKQGFDQDPAGEFTRTWVPELNGLEGSTVHKPWKSDRAFNYPERVVLHQDAVRESKSRIWEIRSTAAAKLEAQSVYERHGSRKRSRRKQQDTRSAK